MNPFSRYALPLLIAFALTGCSKRIDRPSPVPTAISSSAQVAKVVGANVSISQSSPAEAVVTLSISPGFHVNANPATFPYLIATELTADKVEGIAVGSPVYPAAQKKKFQFADEPLSVYEGKIPIKVNLRVEANAMTGTRTLPVKVRVQACDEEQCFPPATINTTITATVK